VSGDSSEAGDAFAANEGVYVRSLDVCRAVVAAAEACVAGARPGFRKAWRQALRIDAEVESCGCVSPDLPGRRGGFEAIQEPGLLFGAEDCLRRFGLAEVGDVLVAKGNGVRWFAAGIDAAGVQ